LLPDILKGESPVVKPYVLGQIAQYKIDVRVNRRVEQIKPEGVVCEYSGAEEFVQSDSVVLAFGFSPDSAFVEDVKSHAKAAVISVGDASKVADALSATRDGFSKTLAAVRGL